MNALPRYFWRRGFAFFIDLVIISVIFTFIAVGLSKTFNMNLIAPNLINSTVCNNNLKAIVFVIVGLGTLYSQTRQPSANPEALVALLPPCFGTCLALLLNGKSKPIGTGGAEPTLVNI